MARAQKSGKGGNSFVLMIGDEGAILIQMQRKRVVRRLFAQSPEPMHTRGFEDALDAYPNAPITMLIDMMDQSYIRQTLPPVSSFSISRIVRRRMDKDFSPDDIKGYLILEREKTGRRDWNYLMVSLANPPLLQKWIQFAAERSNPYRGMGLIPLEAQPMLVEAQKRLLKNKPKDTKPLEWQILVNHHKVGGFRQIVLRGGKLTFTRMAQMVGEAQPDVIAGNIEQEMINTLEYLKRLGLSDPSTLSVIVVASEEIKRALDFKNIRAGEVHFFTPFEITELLELRDAAQPEDHFGDVATSAFIARQRKLLLPLDTLYTIKLRKLSRYITAARACGALAVLGLFALSGMNGWDIFTAKQDIEKAESDGRRLHSDMEALREKAKLLPKQINTFTDVVNLSKMFDQRHGDPMTFVSTFAATLQNAALVTGSQWTLAQPLSVVPGGDKRPIEAKFVLKLTKPHDPVKDYIASAKDLIDRLKKAFPDYDVTHTELPGLLAETKDLKTVIDDSGSNSSEPVGTSVLVDNVSVTLKFPQGPANGK